MLKKLTRRQRSVVFTSLAGVLFLIVLLIIFWPTASNRSYIPGEDIEGLTSDLDRSVPEGYPNVQFQDVTMKSGINFQHFYGERTSQLPEDMGSGVAWADYDNDGWEDLFIANEIGPLTMDAEEMNDSPAHSALYHNNGDGTFTEVSEAAGVDLRTMAIAVAWGDYNNDTWPDLLVTNYGENYLFHNNGDGTFSDVSKSAGVNGIDGFWAGASWGDFDLDGNLDLYICGYVKYVELDSSISVTQYNVEVPVSINPSSFSAERNLLYKNNGDGTFTEIGKAAKVDGGNGKSLSAVWCDFDDDGWPDLYVANDVSDNVLYRNIEGRAFEEISRSAFVADYRGAMGIGVGDWDNDQDMDMFITHWMAQENALYSNLLRQAKGSPSKSVSKIRFMDEADRYGLGQIALDFIGFGTLFLDYNGDGKLDIFIANGSTFQQDKNPKLLIPMKDQLFWNKGDKEGFFDVSAVSGAYFAQKYGGRGTASADFDNDGDIDLFVVNNVGPGLLLKNEGGNTNNWAKIHLVGVESNKMAIGAKIRLVADDLVQVRQVGAQGSYCSQNSLKEIFGLGDYSQIDTLQIVWPGGLQQSFTNLPVNKLIRIVEGETSL
jgi:enediyne biosynthesis protein E4